MECTLDKLKIGDLAVVTKNNSKIKDRLIEIGLIENTKVECVINGAKNGINAYIIRGAVIAIRKEDAENIFVIKRG